MPAFSDFIGMNLRVHCVSFWNSALLGLIKGSENSRAFPNHVIDKETYENLRRIHTADYLLFEAYEKLKFKRHMRDPADR